MILTVICSKAVPDFSDSTSESVLIMSRQYKIAVKSKGEKIIIHFL